MLIYLLVYCSSQPSMVHWLSSCIFPCSSSRYGDIRPNLHIFNFIVIVFLFNLYFWSKSKTISSSTFGLPPFSRTVNMNQNWQTMCSQNYFHFLNRKWQVSHFLNRKRKENNKHENDLASPWWPSLTLAAKLFFPFDGHQSLHLGIFTLRVCLGLRPHSSVASGPSLWCCNDEEEWREVAQQAGLDGHQPGVAMMRNWFCDENLILHLNVTLVIVLWQ